MGVEASLEQCPRPLSGMALLRVRGKRQGEKREARARGKGYRFGPPALRARLMVGQQRSSFVDASGSQPMANAADVYWETCTVDGCMGSRSLENGTCLAHLAPEELATALEGIGRDGRVDARGVEISADLLERILSALPRTPRRRPRFKDALFWGAVFSDAANFDSVTFEGDAWFNGATFPGDATFEKATFTGEAIFGDAIFEEGASFRSAIFKGGASFTGATFAGQARFERARFRGETFFTATFQAFAGFGEATFTDDAWFEEASFEEHAGFSAATFKGVAAFNGATFAGDARFGGATFRKEAGFVEATFGPFARFDDGAIFKGPARFEKARFTGEAGFGGARFERDASFDRATFTGGAWFGGAVFTRDATFGRATFTQGARFDGATFNRAAEFVSVTFEHARWFGPILALGALRLENASFLEAADIHVSADRLSLARARFPAGTRIWTRFAEINLEKATFGATSLLAASSEFQGLDEAALSSRYEGDPIRSARPRLLSMRWASVENLTLSGIDLSPCRFFGAHHLDGLRLEGGSSFALTPAHYRVTRRQAIAEEHEWRNAHTTPLSAPGWYPEECGLPDDFHESEVEATDIATIYRDLRKGRESNKDEPGAADFYYGEMEMRRLAGSAAGQARERSRETEGRPPRSPGRLTSDRGEHFILTLYWLVSGYGLRASRALASLFVTVLVFAALLYVWGFNSDESFISSLTFSFESTTSLFRPPERDLTIPGEWLQVGLRLLGPLFFGLALLSLRGRVRR